VGGLSKLLRDRLYRVYKRRFTVRIREGEMRPADGLSNVIRLPFKLKRSNRDYSQIDVLLPSMVPSHLSSMRSISI
jgi:hypothetical protein